MKAESDRTNLSRRVGAHQHLYGKRAWRRRAQQQLREHPLCAFCLAQGIVEPARCADHIEPHHGDPVRFYTGALQSLCFPCHQRRKRLIEQRGFDPAIGLDGFPIDPLHPANRGTRWE
jgi:5-methylcytosine-specific restriction protein A